MKNPPSWKLRKIYKALATLHKTTLSEIDDEFGQVEETEKTFEINCEIQSVTLEDITLTPAGALKEGDAWGYFLPSYSYEGKNYTIEADDYITYQGIKYLVTRVTDMYSENGIVFKRAVLRRQVGV